MRSLGSEELWAWASAPGEKLFPGCPASAVRTLPWGTVSPGVGPELAVQACGARGRWTRGSFSPQASRLQGTGPEHVPVPASLRGVWLHHSLGICFPDCRQHFPRAAPQEGNRAPDRWLPCSDGPARGCPGEEWDHLGSCLRPGRLWPVMQEGRALFWAVPSVVSWLHI